MLTRCAWGPFVTVLALGALLGACSDGDEAVASQADAATDSGGGGVGDGLVEDTADAGVADAADTADTGGGSDVAGTDADPGTDAGPEETETVGSDVEADVSGCPGGDNCACATNNDCQSKVCLDTPNGMWCAQPCTDTCSPGFACKNIGDQKPLFFCVSTLISLCSPCKFHSDCQVQGVPSLCLDYGTDGKFCGAPCAGDADCPSGYACSDAQDGAGATVKQCKRTSPGGQPAVCECSAWAKSQGLETDCAITNEFGTCKASRKCGDAGLGGCAAKAPASEVCNLQDDNCDGDTDDLPVELKCTVKGYLDAGSLVDCKSDAECKTAGEGCELASGKCKTLIGACPGKPSCSADGKLECKDAKTPAVEACNGEDDDCDGVKDELFVYKGPDGVEAGIGATCGAGAWAGGTVVCADTKAAACSSADKAAAKEVCDGADEDCNGKADDLACEDGNACTKDTCDAGTKSCSNTASVACDDKDPCTADSCDKASGACVYTGATGSCDDGNPCTVGDACAVVDGKGACKAGKDVKDCDDSNPCTDDTCNVVTGCKQTPNSGQVECFNAPAKTAGVGICKKGKQFCQNGKMLDKCEGEVIPAKSEACDGKDDDCDGFTDEGCTPTDVAVTFAAAKVMGKVGQNDIEMLVGRGSPAGMAKGGIGSKYDAEFGFYAWLKALLKK